MPYSPTAFNPAQIVNGVDPQTPAPGSTALSASFLNALHASIIAYIQSELVKVGDYVDQVAPSTKITTPTYTFVAGDIAVRRVGNSPTAQTFTIPPHSSVPFANGVSLTVLQYGAGQITIAGGAGVVVHPSPGHLAKAFGQYSTIEAYQVGQDEWILSGDLA